MGRGVAVEAFDLFGVVQKAGDDLFLLRLAQAGFIGEGLGDADGLHAFDRDHLRQLVDLTVRELQDPAHVADGGLGQQSAEGDDLGHLVAAVFFLDVGDDLFPAVHAEVDVEVGHRDAFGVQEAFEQQRVAQGIKVGDRQGIGDQGTCARAPARTDGNVVVLGPFDEVGHDQEIAGETHLLDDRQLEIEAGLVFLGRGGMGDDLEAGLQAFVGLTAKLVHLVIGEFRAGSVCASAAA